jgi:hypothetical protein
MRWLCLGLVVVLGFACEEDRKKRSSDDDDGGQGGATGGGGATSAGGATTTSSAGGGAPSDCFQACSDLYDCGLEPDGATQLCPGFTGTATEKNSFLFGSGADGCIANCEALPALVALVDPNDCPTTVETISGVNATFDDVCQFGLETAAP